MLIAILASFALGVYVADLQNRKLIENWKRASNTWKAAYEIALSEIGRLSKERRELNGKT